MSGVKDFAKNLEDLTPYGDFYPYATYIKGRGYSEHFKRHRTIGHARNALNTGKEHHTWRSKANDDEDFKLYEWQEGKWVEIS